MQALGYIKSIISDSAHSFYTSDSKPESCKTFVNFYLETLAKCHTGSRTKRPSIQITETVSHGHRHRLEEDRQDVMGDKEKRWSSQTQHTYTE